MPHQFKIAPSILSADFARLGEQVQEAERAGGDYIHLDVMDGHFVPNLTMGPVVVRSIRRHTSLPFDAHLMVEKPQDFLEEFATAGVDIITVQAETGVHLHRIIQKIKGLGKKAGVAINPATPAIALEEILPDLDLVLVMTVNPGFGGQPFIPNMVPKIARVRAMLDAIGSKAELEVDGGIDPDTATAVVRAGARVLVAGSAVFKSGGMVADSIARIRERGIQGLYKQV